jgi:hypothetical protein
MRNVFLISAALIALSGHAAGQDSVSSLTFKTEKFIIKIYSMPDYKYKYASWGINKSIADKPDLVLLNGEHVFDGSGGNNHYEFKNDEYLYIIRNTILGTGESVPYDLTIYKNDEKILYQPAEKI